MIERVVKAGDCSPVPMPNECLLDLAGNPMDCHHIDPDIAVATLRALPGHR